MRSPGTTIVFTPPERAENVTASPLRLDRSRLSGRFAANSST